MSWISGCENAAAVQRWNANRTYIATAHANKVVLLWKSADPSPIAWNAFNNEEEKYPHPEEVLSVAFHPRDVKLSKEGESDCLRCEDAGGPPHRTRAASSPCLCRESCPV